MQSPRAAEEEWIHAKKRYWIRLTCLLLELGLVSFPLCIPKMDTMLPLVSFMILLIPFSAKNGRPLYRLSTIRLPISLSSQQLTQSGTKMLRRAVQRCWCANVAKSHARIDAASSLLPHTGAVAAAPTVAPSLRASTRPSWRTNTSWPPSSPFRLFSSSAPAPPPSASKKQPITLREEDLDESFVKGSGTTSQHLFTLCFTEHSDTDVAHVLCIFNGAGKGGQKINKVRNCVLLKHIPTGLHVRCQKTRSLDDNRRVARKLLIQKLDDAINGDLSARNVKFNKLRKKKANKKAKSKQKYSALASESEDDNSEVDDDDEDGDSDADSDDDDDGIDFDVDEHKFKAKKK